MIIVLWLNRSKNHDEWPCIVFYKTIPRVPEQLVDYALRRVNQILFNNNSIIVNCSLYVRARNDKLTY